MPTQPLKGVELQRQLLTKAIKPTTDPGVQRQNEQRYEILRNLPTPQVPLGPGDRPSPLPPQRSGPGVPNSSGVMPAPMPQRFGGPSTSTPAPMPNSIGSDNVIRDLPTPSIPQTSTDQMFLEGIRNKPMGDLTPDEVQQLIDIKQRQAEDQSMRDLSGTYQPLLDASGNEINRLTGELDATKLSEEQRVQQEIDRTFGLVDQKYAPEFENIARQGVQQLEGTQRTFSAAGSGRGNRGMEARQDVERQTAQIEAAKSAEVRLEKQLLEAQIKGASDKVIEGLSKQLNDAKASRAGLEMKQAEAISTLRANLATGGQESVQAFLQNLQTQASLQTYDAGLSAATGKIVDSQGRPILGPDGTALTPGTVPSEASAELSKQLGYLADKSGGAILDTNGQPIPINKGVKSTFQDGSKNTYILFEDGTTQQIGAPGSAGSGSGGGGGGGFGYDESMAAVYSDIAAYTADNPGTSYTQAVDALGYGTSKGVRESLIMGTDAWVNAQLAAMPAPTPEAPSGPGFLDSLGGSSLFNPGGIPSDVRKSNPGSLFDFFL